MNDSVWLVTGGSGQVGGALVAAPPPGVRIIAPTRAELDLANPALDPAWLIERHGVTDMERVIGRLLERLLERRDQRAVELDDVQVRAERREVLAQDAEPAADLEHHVTLLDLGQAIDHAEDVGIDKEVLPQVALGADRVLAHPPQARLGGERALLTGVRLKSSLSAHQPSSSAALRSTTASSCS